MKTIARDDYLQQLIGRKHNGLVKIVTGIRRCGKSYLLFTILTRPRQSEPITVQIHHVR